MLGLINIRIFKYFLQYSIIVYGCDDLIDINYFTDLMRVSSQKTASSMDMGWALGKPRSGGVRFSEKVRLYLTAKFEMGERTGRKADPDEVALSMRKARNERNERLFERDEWLTKTQITGFFSRLSARSRSRGQDAFSLDETVSQRVDDDEDIEALIRESDRCTLMDDIQSRIGLKHPVVFDTFDLCDYYKNGKIEAFNVAMLKKIIRHFEIAFLTKDRKVDLVKLLKEVIQEFECCRK